MEVGVWIAIVGLVVAHGGTLVAVLVRRAKWEQLMESRICEAEQDLLRGRERFAKLEATVDAIKEDSSAIKLKLTEVATLLRAHLGKLNGNMEAGG